MYVYKSLMSLTFAATVGAIVKLCSDGPDDRAELLIISSRVCKLLICCCIC